MSQAPHAIELDEHLEEVIRAVTSAVNWAMPHTKDPKVADKAILNCKEILDTVMEGKVSESVSQSLGIVCAPNEQTSAAVRDQSRRRGESPWARGRTMVEKTIHIRNLDQEDLLSIVNIEERVTGVASLSCHENEFSHTIL